MENSSWALCSSPPARGKHVSVASARTNRITMRAVDPRKEPGLVREMALIRAHPDLVGRAALAGTLTQASTSEQAGAGLHRLTPEEIATFQKYNSEYREKFGFPFVICARLNKKAAILEAFPRRLKNSMQEEMRAALEEIYKIAYFRLQDIFTQQ